MSMSSDQKRIIQDIVGVFETGKAGGGDYSAVTILHDGAGVSYGKHQATDRSDSLDAIVLRYLDLGGMFADELMLYLDRLERDVTAGVDPDDPPDWVIDLMDLLKRAGDEDPLMKQAQDQVFDVKYWQPASDQATAMQLQLPLSWLIVYDSTIQSGVNGVANIRKKFSAMPPSKDGDERTWATAYLNARKTWLLSSSKEAVRKSVYRVNSMLELTNDGNWELEVPLTLLAPKVTVE